MPQVSWAVRYLEKFRWRAVSYPGSLDLVIIGLNLGHLDQSMCNGKTYPGRSGGSFDNQLAASKK